MISVIVVHWNTPDLLYDCLISLRDSRPNDLAETIVVDCASDREHAAGLVSKFNNTTLVQMDRNDGYAAGCNAGIPTSSGEFLLFLNADTTVAPGAIDTLRACFDLNPRIGLVAPLLLNPDHSIQSSGYTFPGAINVVCDLLPVPDRLVESELNGRVSPGNQGLPFAVDYALGAAVAVRREALDAVGGWDESYGMYSEEIELARRLADADWTRLVEPRAIVVHHGGASTGQRPNEMQTALWRSRGMYHRRWTTPRKRALLRAIVEGASRVRLWNPQGEVVREAFAAGIDS